MFEFGVESAGASSARVRFDLSGVPGARRDTLRSLLAAELRVLRSILDGADPTDLAAERQLIDRGHVDVLRRAWV